VALMLWWLFRYFQCHAWSTLKNKHEDNIFTDMMDINSSSKERARKELLVSDLILINDPSNTVKTQVVRGGIIYLRAKVRDTHTSRNVAVSKALSSELSLIILLKYPDFFTFFLPLLFWVVAFIMLLSK
jgi:hypothetical protein